MKLKIGDFARLGRISVSALRFYDEEGLLRPASTDNWTGYRHYELDQLPTLNRILALKDLGLSLDQIRAMLGDELTPEQLRGMLRLKQSELQQEAQELQERLVRVEARIRQIEREGKMPNYDIVLKKVEPLQVAMARGVVPNVSEAVQTFTGLFDEVLEHLNKHKVAYHGPGIAVYYDIDFRGEDLNVAAAVPANGSAPNGDRVTLETLPGADTVLSVIHRGPTSTMMEAYRAILTWIEENGYRRVGPVEREVLLNYVRGSDGADHVTEIQIPVEKV
jgi:DNA-binding transcriptional MerR regulator